MLESALIRSTNRHIHRLPSPWQKVECHTCGTEVRTGDALYLDTDGGLYCTYFCSTQGPRPGCGGVQERSPSYSWGGGLCVDCAEEIGLPSNVYLAGYECGNCRHLHPAIHVTDAIQAVWQGAQPEDVGLMECRWCNGYGSSFKDPEGCQCSSCAGSGLVPMTLEHRIRWTQAHVANPAQEVTP